VTVRHSSHKSKRFARLLTRVPLVLSKHLWIWPVLGAVLISVAGLWTRSLVEGAIKAELAARLQTVLNANVSAVRLWFSERESDVRVLAADRALQDAVVELSAMAQRGTAPSNLVECPPARELQMRLPALLPPDDYLDYLVVDTDRKVLATPRRYLVGRLIPAPYDPFIRRAIEGQVAFSRPITASAAESRPDGPTMLVAAPVRGTNGAVAGVLGLRLRAQEKFSRIFSVTQMGMTGEAYAFDRRGVMLTASRVQQGLSALGFMTNSADTPPAQNLELLDPIKTDQSPASVEAPKQARLTRMAAAAIKGLNGTDVDGYRNYRGVTVVGSWAWLPEYGLGVAVEVAGDEAFQTLYLVRRVFFSLFLMLLSAGAGIFAFSLLVERLQASVRRAALAERRLGQYVLLQEIGRGANSTVYRARHTLLRRPVAVKLLSPELTDEAHVARFEHEVQMTSQLTHANTVAVYDYGRTPEGLLYYAMEYLSGIDLHRLVRQFGPLPEARVIHLLRQICGSLAEAHRVGLIHRDIKPANLILTRRAGSSDVIKVLDFGIVKAIHHAPKGVAPDAVVGTPHFMSPEAIASPETVDNRTDLYSVGAVGYWLLTGKTLFAGHNVELLLAKQVQEEPTPIWKWLHATAANDLQKVIMQCLSKNPEERPATAEALEDALSRCEHAGEWTEVDAAAWWRDNLQGLEQVPETVMPEKTLVIAPRR
jgi:tRNA A-37 threonylcarbamoyl transferase component Bud32